MSTAARSSRPRFSGLRRGPAAIRVNQLNHWYGDDPETRKQVLYENDLQVAAGVTAGRGSKPAMIRACHCCANLAVSLALIVRNSLAYNLLSVIASR